MTFPLNRTIQVTGSGIALTASKAFAYSGNPHVSEEIAPGTTTVNCALAYAVLSFLAIFANGTLTLQAKAAGGGSIGDPIVVTLTTPFIWDSDGGLANPFNQNVVSFEVTNAGESVVQLNIEPMADATP